MKEWDKMDTNPISCPTCGHAVMQAADACAYCGAILSHTEPDPGRDQPKMEAELQAETSTPLPQQHGITADTETIEEPDVSTEAAFEQPLPDPIDQILLKETPPQESPPSGDIKADEDVVMGVADEPAEPASSDEQTGLESPADEPRLIDEAPVMLDKSATGSSERANVLTSVPEALAELIPADTEPAGETSAAAENEAQEVVNAHSESDDALIIPEEILKSDSQEPVKPEPLEVEIVELADGKDSQTESIPSTVFDADITPIEAGLDLRADVTEIEIAPEDKKSDDDGTVLPAGEAMEEAILLTADDEVQIPKKESPDKAVETNRAKVSTKQKVTRKQAKTNELPESALAAVNALTSPKEAQVDLQASKSQKRRASTKPRNDAPGMIRSGLESNSKTLSLLKKYEGQSIGINYDNSADIREAELVEVNDEFFSVMVESKAMKYSYPLKTLLTVIEGNDGVEIGENEPKARFNAVIKVCPLVLF